MFNFRGSINLKSLVKRFVSDSAAVAASYQDSAVTAPCLPPLSDICGKRAEEPEKKEDSAIQVRLKCTVKNDIQYLYRAIKYVSDEYCEFLETVRHGDKYELTIKTGNISVTRKVCGVLKDLTGFPVEGEIVTPTTRILLQY